MSDLTTEESTGHLHVVVASLTRNRPEMLGALLESWAGLEHPPHATVEFFVVENNTAPDSAGVVSAYEEKHPKLSLNYFWEPVPGIPVARNRALAQARERGADLLCFVDDDEEVSKDWLLCLIRRYRKTKAVAIGGPVRPRRPSGLLSPSEDRMFRAVEKHDLRREAKIAARVARSNFNHLTISSNNCLYALEPLHAARLTFDSQTGFAGGTDAKMSSDIRKAGLPIDWATDAVVFETQPRARLAPAYIYRSSRDRANTYVARKLTETPSYGVALAVFVLARIGSAAFQIALVPLWKEGHYALLRNLGWIAGAFAAVLGRPSELYKEVTGY